MNQAAGLRSRVSTTGRAVIASSLWIALIALPAFVSAQSRFDVQQLNPAPSQFYGYFGQPSSVVLDGGRLELGVFANYADDPLVLFDLNGDRVSRPVAAQFAMNLLVGYGIADWFEIGLDVPLVLYQKGDDFPALPEIIAPDAGFGLGDIRLVPKVMLLRPQRIPDPVGLGLSFLIDARFPTGDVDSFQGEDFRIEPALALDYWFANRIRLGAFAGYVFRSESTLGNVEVDDSITWSAAAAFPLFAGLTLVPEVQGDVSILADSIDGEEFPLEALLGLKWFIGRSFLIEGGGGMGLVRGAGTPDWRAFGGVAWSPAPGRDRDGDGIDDDDDACPDDPEDFDGFQDQDGCPDPDNDGDGIPDTQDGCPNEAEDADGFEDQNGCPDPDNDGDGIPDAQDGCPNDPENFNDYQDGDGCPDEVSITVTCEAIIISDRVHFETDSDAILSRSFDLLNGVAATIQRAEWIREVRIEGHTDSRNTDAYNQDLSERRANSVRTYLVDHGVAAERLTTQGFGESRPIATNETEDGRAANRRVEFVITSQEGCPEQPVTE